jgi:hypothetical protein
MNDVILILATVGLIMSNISDIVSLFARCACAIVQKNALGGHASMVVSLFNRFFVTIYLLGTAFLIDKGIDTTKLLVSFGVSLLLAGLIMYVLSLNAVSIYKLFWRFYSFEVKNEIIFGKKESRNKIVSCSSFFVYIVNSVGLTIPFVLASFNPEYRAALTQVGALINVFSTLVNTIYIEKNIANIFENSVAMDSNNLVSLITISRANALICIGVFYIVISILAL